LSTWSKLSFTQVALNAMIESIMADYRLLKDDAGTTVFKTVERAKERTIECDHEDATPMARFFTEYSELQSDTVGHQLMWQYERPRLVIELIYHCADDELLFADHQERFAHYVLDHTQAPDSENTEGVEVPYWWGLPAQRATKQHEKLPDPGFWKTTLTLTAECWFNEDVTDGDEVDE
jgi:hypothetical protein